jgi:hypothetical protein
MSPSPVCYLLVLRGDVRRDEMKKFFALVLMSALALSANALNLFAGAVNAQSAGSATSVVGGLSGAANSGLSFSGAQNTSQSAGEAGGTVNSSGIAVGQVNQSGSTGVSTSGALGNALGGSLFGGSGTSSGSATGQFGSIGIGF